MSRERRSAWLALALIGLAVVYGSLVPLDWRPLPLAQAWGQFQAIRLLEIGTEHRADWIANIVLYLPVGFLGLHALRTTWPRAAPAALFALTMAAAAALAVGVEFAQLFFPPRTVSLNDIAAEVMGSLLGAAVALRWSAAFGELLSDLWGHLSRHGHHLLALYALAYLAYVLFPYDVVLSWRELADKMADAPPWGWLAGGGGGDSAVIRLIKLGVLVVASAPVGAWLAARRASRDQWGGHSSTRSRSLWQPGTLVLLLCAAIGVELARLFMLSGTPQVMSGLGRAAGMAAGVALWARRDRYTLDDLARAVRRSAAWALPVWLLLVLLVNGWQTTRWLDGPVGGVRWADVRWIPFYYHYFTTEKAALISAASVVATYLPLGVAMWAHGRGPRAAAVAAGAIAALMEACKVSLMGVYADPTNALLAAGACAAVPWALRGLRRSTPSSALAEPARTARAGAATVSETAPTTSARSPSNRGRSEPGRRMATHRSATQSLPSDRGSTAARTDLTRSLAWAWAWAAAMACVAWGVWGFPTQPVLLGLALAAALAATWVMPPLALAMVPAALALDLAPWAGVRMVSEFDLLTMALLATAAWRMPSAPHVSASAIAPTQAPALFDGPARLAIGAVVLTLAIGAARSRALGDGWHAGGLASITGAWTGVKLGVAALEGLALAWLAGRMGGAGRRFVSAGLAAALTLTIVAMVWERLAFAAGFDAESDYRATALVASMNTGGAHVECLIAVAAAFVAAAAVRARHATGRLLGMALLAAGAAAVVLTYSRAGIAAYALAVLASAMLATRAAQPGASRRWWALALLGVAAAAAWPLLAGSYAQSRLQAVGADFDTRRAHWAEVAALRSEGWLPALVGEGLGRYPLAHYWRHAQDRHAGSATVAAQSGAAHLALGGGDAVYVEQIVDIDPTRPLRLELSARSVSAAAELGLSLCEKWLLVSLQCVQIRVPLPASTAADGPWQEIALPVDASPLGRGAWSALRTIKLALHTPMPGRVIQVAQVHLLDDRQRDRLANGDFDHGLAHWYYSADNHLQWHVKNLPLALWFELGWLGLALVLAAATLALARAWRSSWRRAPAASSEADDDRAFSGALVGALLAFAFIGLFDTLIDAPRFMFLATLLGALALAPPPQAHRKSP